MDLLKLMNNTTSDIQITKYTKKLSFDGETKAYQVYKINLDKLFYNDQNDRIATWLSKFKSEKHEFPEEIEEKNQIIERFIIESNQDKIKKTTNNIKLFGQREPGIVLKDGRIIDGNRRFTCLRQLFRENPLNFKYFEAVILDKDIENDLKQIKLLELAVQHGEESKVDYNPIDRLVGIYNDVIKNKLLTPDEYIQSANMKKSDFESKVLEAQLMADFLEYINQNENFYIARDLELDGPLNELVQIVKKANEDDVEDVKNAAFNLMTLHTSSQMTPEIRKIKKIINSNDDSLKVFLNEQQEIGEELLTKLSEGNVESCDALRDISNDTLLIRKARVSLDRAYENAGITNAKKAPIVYSGKAVEILNRIDLNIIQKLEVDDISELSENLDTLERLIQNIREKLNV